MATSAYRCIQDQNLNILYSVATPRGKTDVAKADKKGGLGGRKALNDISNSRKPSVLHSVKKDNPLNVISVEKDHPSAFKAKPAKAANKGKVGGRKALSDLTNSAKPPTKQVPTMDRKLNAVPEDIIELHNHQECIKAQIKAVDMEVDVDYFLQSVGLCNDNVQQARGIPISLKKPKSTKKHLEMEEMPEHLYHEDQVICRKKSELPGFCSPACRSPHSAKAPYMKWDDDCCSDLTMIESPKVV